MAKLSLRHEQQIVVALGGGVDSQTVLALTQQYRKDHPQYQYLAIHLDHAFHPSSGEWAEFLDHECKQKCFPHIIEPLLVQSGARISKEAAGRDARYRRLAELTKPDAVILLGQHLSDQAETFLLQLKRGAGPKGLAAMAQVAVFNEQRRLARPLLAYTKEEIYRFARAHELQWIEDDTNFDTRIDRNFLRHEIIPKLKARWPSIEKTMARSAELCAEQQSLLEELLLPELEARQACSGALNVQNWNTYSTLKHRALLRLWLERQGASLPSQAVLNELVMQLARLPQGKVQVRWGQWQVKRVKRELVLSKLS
ncbi:MAG: tRNA(Ile)-lysidine synthase TilS [Idiomarinaceae bacterium HL-53]|nr:MAG: tRNA(Ile)-lysidine synthase TilS [Idiomarinaceae bacterium HL-53]CUS48692.1 tRNA(Ile)-lysidine synthetase, N-terminal domain-containing protein [Idiomarinaceae bacterium HL-53]